MMSNGEFPEGVKLEARRLAAFKCYICHDRPGDEVHHIDAKADGGSNDIGNAVFLCAQCHTDFGTRAEKRKQIIQSRDWWYEQVRNRYSVAVLDQVSRIEQLATKDDIAALRSTFGELTEQLIQSLQFGSTTASGVANVASTMLSSISAHAPRHGTLSVASQLVFGDSNIHIGPARGAVTPRQTQMRCAQLARQPYSGTAERPDRRDGNASAAARDLSRIPSPTGSEIP